MTTEYCSLGKLPKAIPPCRYRGAMARHVHSGHVFFTQIQCAAKDRDVWRPLAQCKVCKEKEP